MKMSRERWDLGPGRDDGAQVVVRDLQRVFGGDDGEHRADDLRTPGNFLRWLERGAYTAARLGVTATDDGTGQVLDLQHHIPLWPKHSIRLVNSLAILFPEAVPRHLDREEAASFGAEVDAAVRANLSRALQSYNPAKGGKTETEEVTMVTIAVRPRPRLQSSSERDERDERDDRPAPLSVAVHLCSTPLNRMVPIDLLLRTCQRKQPRAKSCAWAADRLPLERDLKAAQEAGRDAGANFSEVLMAASDGRLLEGMRSSFFVVRALEAHERRGGGGAGETAATPGICLQTCPVSSGILPGIIRQLVIELARDKEICTKVEDLALSDSSLWEEAFVTSGVKFLQPVRRIASRPSGGSSIRIEKEFHHASGPITTRIMEEIERLVSTA